MALENISFFLNGVLINRNDLEILTKTVVYVKNFTYKIDEIYGLFNVQKDVKIKCKIYILIKIN